MTQYAALIYGADNDWTQPQYADTTAEYAAFAEAASAVIRGGAALYPTSTATSVRVKAKGGTPLTTDGPGNGVIRHRGHVTDRDWLEAVAPLPAAKAVPRFSVRRSRSQGGLSRDLAPSGRFLNARAPERRLPGCRLFHSRVVFIPD